MSKHQESLREILPTIERVCSRTKSLSYSLRNTYKEKSHELKHQLASLKIKNMVSLFGKKLKRNLVSSKPVIFEVNKKNI